MEQYQQIEQRAHFDESSDEWVISRSAEWFWDQLQLDLHVVVNSESHWSRQDLRCAGQVRASCEEDVLEKGGIHLLDLSLGFRCIQDKTFEVANPRRSI